ncbi:hypothetical protein [uncultured Mediterranean phage uvMED]|jgi:metal-responsive CopG/Arc/MetJ family transcriptional regulator|nr:hypothetical protein [uncultured Mediterranean phage uvMED]|tara:strand:+ start:1812 stop:1964 length:153 start_codon:yes stop_codon:yes gene_type:complete
MEKKKIKKVGVHIEKSLWDEVNVIAKKQFRSASALVRMIISNYVEENKND